MVRLCKDIPFGSYMRNLRLMSRVIGACINLAHQCLKASQCYIINQCTFRLQINQFWQDVCFGHRRQKKCCRKTRGHTSITWESMSRERFLNLKPQQIRTCAINSNLCCYAKQPFSKFLVPSLDCIHMPMCSEIFSNIFFFQTKFKFWIKIIKKDMITRVKPTDATETQHGIDAECSSRTLAVSTRFIHLFFARTTLKFKGNISQTIMYSE